MISDLKKSSINSMAISRKYVASNGHLMEHILLVEAMITKCLSGRVG